MVAGNAGHELDETAETGSAVLKELPRRRGVAMHVAAPPDRSATSDAVAPVTPVRLKSCTAAWPPQADLVMSAIETGRHGGGNRRVAPRRRLRVKAGLRLFSDSAQTPAWAVYTRDVHARGLGFITPHRLPLGHGGVVELPTEDGGSVRIACTLLRCREAAPGWFEGSLYFNRDQPGLT